jgi:hypothetical protein
MVTTRQIACIGVFVVVVTCGRIASAQEGGIRNPSFLQPNPVVHDSGRYVTGEYTGAFGIRRHVETNRDRVHASAFDDDRDLVDPGSAHRVDEWVPNGHGGWARRQGYTWTSNGVPHGDVNSSRTYRDGWFRTRTDNTRVLYCPAR